MRPANTEQQEDSTLIHCEPGCARPLSVLYTLIPEPYLQGILDSMKSSSPSCLLEYVVRYGEWIRNQYQGDITALLSSNKEWGDKYGEACRQRDEVTKGAQAYRDELVKVREYLLDENYTQYPRWIEKLLAQFPQPITKDNGLSS